VKGGACALDSRRRRGTPGPGRRLHPRGPGHAEEVRGHRQGPPGGHRGGLAARPRV